MFQATIENTADAVAPAVAPETISKAGDGGTTAMTNMAETAMGWQQSLMGSFQKAIDNVLAIAPGLIAAIVVMVIGYIISRLLAKGVSALAEKIGLQKAADRGGLVQSMEQVGIKRTVPQIIGTIVFWLLMGVFLIASCDIVGLDAVSQSIQGVLNYVPNLVVAAVIVVLGLLLASFLRGVIAASADRVGVSFAKQLASACYYVLVMMTFIAAFEQLKIEFPLVNYAILIAFGAIAVALGLSFGLGGRDVVAGILSGYYVRQRLHAGDKVSVAGFEGTVRDVGPVATIIETEEDGLVHRHSIPNAKMLNEAVR